MTTVVLTPTHIASDHCMIKRGVPNQVSWDLTNQKLFINPTKQIVIGLSGDYDQSQIDTPQTWAQIKEILFYTLAAVAEFGLEEGAVGLKGGNLSIDHYKRIFDLGGQTMIVSRNYRFLIQYSRSKDCLVAKQLGPYAGIGSGGIYATGLLMGGANIHHMWDALHKLDHLSSREHTVIPLSSLKKMTKTEQILHDIKSDITNNTGKES